MEIHNENDSFAKNKEETIKYINILSVKSIYITKLILSFLSENIKFNIIKYNKNYQNKFGFNIEDYKRVSGKYKMIDKNGIERIYDSDTNKLLFKGQKNGKGIEFDEDGDIIFEGRYLNGKKIEGKGFDYKGNIILQIQEKGKGKEYYDNGNLKFEGEYLNGRRWNGKYYNYEGKEEFTMKNGRGQGKEYDYNGNILFEGEYISGKRYGKGKEYYNNSKLKFEGEYLNDERNGKGTEFNIHNSILLFKGEYLKGKRHGKGKEYHNNGEIQFEGKYLKGKKKWKRKRIFLFWKSKI